MVLYFAKDGIFGHDYDESNERAIIKISFDPDLSGMIRVQVDLDSLPKARASSEYYDFEDNPNVHWYDGKEELI